MLEIMTILAQVYLKENLQKLKKTKFMVKLLESYHFSELIRPVDEQIIKFEIENSCKVYRIDYLGTICIGGPEYISYYLIWYRPSMVHKIRKKIGQFWAYICKML